MTPAVRHELSDAEMANVIANPILAAPAELRPDVWRVWAAHSHLFPSLLPIAFAVGRWVREDGLHPADAGTLLRRALRPSQMSEFRFASDLMTWLATSAKELKDRRRSRSASVVARPGAEYVAGIGEEPSF